MQQNFWSKLPKPFFCLAPMEEVSDFAFREMFARHSGAVSRRDAGGNGFVMFTEFVNIDGLLHPQGGKKLAADLKYSERQRPIVAQIWGTDPEKFHRAAALVADLGFDGVDINMGCPQSREIALGACAALIRNPQLALEIIQAVREGAGGLPVSVKTRLGYSDLSEMEDWVTVLLKSGIQALTLHARTKKEMSKVPAHWEKIREAVTIRDRLFKPAAFGQDGSFGESSRPLIIGNGDVRSRPEGLIRASESGCDGVMVARGAFGNPWLFREIGQEGESAQERLTVMIEHARLYEEVLGREKPFALMRKHFKAYASGFPGSAELRAKLLQSSSLDEAETIVREYLNSAGLA